METLFMKNKKSLYSTMILIFTLIVVFMRGNILSNAYWAYVDKEAQEKDSLLHGFNVFAGNEISLKNAFDTNSYIIDTDNDEYLKHIVKREIVDGISWYSSADNLLSVEQDYSDEIGQDLFGNIYIINTGLQSQFNTYSGLNGIVDRKYELYTMAMGRHSYLCDITVDDIKKYISSNFKSDLYAVDSLGKAEALFEKYGTHLLTGATYGGRINITSYTATNSENMNLKEGASLEKKIEYTLSTYAAGIDNNTEYYSAVDNTVNYKTNYSFTTYGGAAISALNIESLFSYTSGASFSEAPSRPFELWSNSVQEDENLVIVSIPAGAKAIPIWELIDEEESNSYSIRKLLVECYLKLCNKKYNDFLKNQGVEANLKTITEIKVDLSQSSIEFLDKRFKIGERLSLKDLDGLGIRITYSDGTNKTITSLQEAEELELIDPVIGEDGCLILSTKDYSSYVDLNLTVIQEEHNNNVVSTENQVQEDEDLQENNITNVETQENLESNIDIPEATTNKEDDKKDNLAIVWILVIIILGLVIIILVLIKKGNFKKIKGK